MYNSLNPASAMISSKFDLVKNWIPISRRFISATFDLSVFTVVTDVKRVKSDIRPTL